MRTKLPPPRTTSLINTMRRKWRFPPQVVKPSPEPSYKTRTEITCLPSTAILINVPFHLLAINISIWFWGQVARSDFLEPSELGLGLGI